MIRHGFGTAARGLASMATSSSSSEGSSGRAGIALELYVRRARAHETMMEREREDFQRGRRHLANMMGVDEHTMTQDDVDRAITYLFPSGLHDPKALPVMKPPDEILPRFNRLSFDNEGRPVGTRFFTLKPAFYGLLSEVATRTEVVYRFASERVGKKDSATELAPMSTGGSVWLSQEKMTKKLNGDKLSEQQYMSVIMALDHLVSLPGSASQATFIHEWREPIASGDGQKLFGPAIPEVTIDVATKRRVATVKTRAKDTYAEVRVSDAGKGKYVVDGQGLDTFQSLQAREILLCPLIITKELGKLDIEATTSGAGGASALPRAVRHAVALCIAALRPETANALRIGGLLTTDPRTRERSKVNQPGARAKWIWKRR